MIWLMIFLIMMKVRQMILYDTFQMILISVFATAENGKINEQSARYDFMERLRKINVKFKNKYGPIVLAQEGGSWRKDVFANYKIRRKDSHDKSKYDWKEIFEFAKKFNDELSQNFPYKSLKIEKAEADDVIAVLCEEYGNYTPIMIVSRDQDFLQLQQYLHVKQYDPVKEQMLETNDPSQFLLDHVYAGDSVDDIPNFLSADNVFVEGIRQTPLTAKIKEQLKNKTYVMTEEQQKNFNRNQVLINFEYIPEEIKNNILDAYNNAETSKSNIFNYFVKNRLRNLMDSVSDY